jgi:trimethylamine:corrinoid methyltransferase-like protein
MTMANWSPTIVPPWSPADLKGILNDALRVLEEIGVECAYEGVRHRLADWEGMSIAGDRVYFTGTLVRDYVEEMRTSSRGLPDVDSPQFTLEGC